MSISVVERLKDAGLSLPEPLVPRAEYVPYIFSGNYIFISGQVSVSDGKSYFGRVGEAIDLETAQKAAEICGLNILSQINAALNGDLERVRHVVRLGGFVQATQTFVEIPQVVNGCSKLMITAFGERGRHSRSAVGVYALPRNAAVEVEALIEVAR